MKRIPTLLLMLLVVAVVGCSGTGEDAEGATDAMKNLGEDATKAVEDVTAAGGDMLEGAADKIESLTGDAKQTAQEYYGKIQEHETKLKEIKATLSEMSPKDLMSDKGKKLKGESEEIMTELSDLKDKLQGLLGQATAG